MVGPLEPLTDYEHMLIIRVARVVTDNATTTLSEENRLVAKDMVLLSRNPGKPPGDSPDP